MELLLIIVGLSYVLHSLFDYLGEGVKPLGNITGMNHKWLFSLWITLWAVPFLILGIHLDSFMMILSASLFLTLTIHPFVSKNNEMILNTGAVGGTLVLLLSLGLDYNLWMGFPLLGTIYLITVIRGIENASFYNAHFAFIILYVSLWMV